MIFRCAQDHPIGIGGPGHHPDRAGPPRSGTMRQDRVKGEKPLRFCSPAMVYSFRMIWSSVLVPGKSWLNLIPVEASEAEGIPKSPQTWAAAASGVTFTNL